MKKKKKTAICLWTLQKSFRALKTELVDSRKKYCRMKKKKDFFNHQKVFYFIKLCFFIWTSITNVFLRLCLKSSLSEDKKYEIKYKASKFPSWNKRNFLCLESSLLVTFFEMYFFRKKFWKCSFWGSNFERTTFEKNFDKRLT